MSILSRLLLGTVLAVLVLAAVGPVRALGGPTIRAPLGSNVTVDGVFQTGEWSDAAHLTLIWEYSNSSLNGAADLYLKNNGTNLLIGVSAQGSTILGTPGNTYTYSLALLFDDNNNGVVNNYDAEKVVQYATPPAGSGWTFLDRHFNTTLGGYGADQFPNGTGTGGFTNYGGPGIWFWEFSIPMSSSSPESFNLQVEGTVGFEIMFTETHSLNYGAQITNQYSYWPLEYTTAGPTGSNPTAQGWATLSRDSSPLADMTPPVIATPTVQPASPGPNDNVTISAMVTDPDSPVYSVSVYYTTDNWKTVNDTILASYNATTHLATAAIPAQPGNSHVKFYVSATDLSNNLGINNNNGKDYSYSVSLAQSLNTSAYLMIGLALGAVLSTGLVIALRAKRVRRQALKS